MPGMYSYTMDQSAPASIQYQDISGNWITCSSVPNTSPNVIQGMQQASSLYEGKRIRAVDADGRVLDIL